MKKNQPSPSPRPPIEELIKRYEYTTSWASTTKTSDTKAAQKSERRLSPIPEEEEPRLSLSEETASAKREEDVVYATFDFSEKPHHSGNKDTVKSRGSEFLYAMVASQKKTEGSSYTAVASQRITEALSEEQIASLLPHNPLVKIYHEEIQRWSEVVYGKKNALQAKMEEIQKNPTAGDDFSWRLANHPESIAKLAGVSVCGITNSARQQAENGVAPLCVAVECYVAAVQYAQKNLSRFPSTELKYYEQSMGSEAMAKILQKPYHSERERGTISTEEVLGMVQGNRAVQRYGAQIQYWCGVVFGNSDILHEKMQEILKDPPVGEQIAWNLTANPTSFHKLAGHNFCNFKTGTRKRAENGLSLLSNAVEDYANAITQVKESILQRDQERQNCQEQSVGLDKQLQKQQELSHSSEGYKHAAAKWQDVAETSRHEHQREPDVRPRKASAPKAMAFAS
ncbi:BID domain-containing T4SS effector [Bartonella gliris]|uniref:BID domain-containing T4SS effector n=1 Tax=Bartonella gliris TaxID=3004109 RepID=UPI00295EF954|nr:BID domain-containing T4SS effector [Bartonella gliris]